MAFGGDFETGSAAMAQGCCSPGRQDLRRSRRGKTGPAYSQDWLVVAQFPLLLPKLADDMTREDALISASDVISLNSV